MITARLSIHYWRARRLSPTAARAAEKQYGVRGVLATVALVEGCEVEAVRRTARAIRREFDELTLPFSDDGWRLVPPARVQRLLDRRGEWQRKWDEAVLDFVGVYPLLVTEAQRNLGQLFHELRYPHPAELESLHELEIDLRPASGGVLELAEAEREAVEESVRRQVTRGACRAVLTIAEQISELAQVLKSSPNLRRDTVARAQRLAAELPELAWDEDTRKAFREAAQHLREAVAAAQREDAGLKAARIVAPDLGVTREQAGEAGQRAAAVVRDVLKGWA